MPALTDKQEGTIQSLQPDKGFGFIRTDDGAEYFFHRSAVADFKALTRGAPVRFVATQGPKGPRAEEVEAL